MTDSQEILNWPDPFTEMKDWNAGLLTQVHALFDRWVQAARQLAAGQEPQEIDAEALQWRIPENLRWLGEQRERPGHVPCGQLTGVFCNQVADAFERTIAENIALKAAPSKPSAGTSAYQMVAAVEVANLETSEALIQMVAATVLMKGYNYRPGDTHLSVTFSPADMDEMMRLYEMDATRDGMLLTVRITPRDGFEAPPVSLYADQGIDDTPAKPQVEAVEQSERPVWAVKYWVDHQQKIARMHDRADAERQVRRYSPDSGAVIENRFCTHVKCPTMHCNDDAL